jgi:single-strand DNA-binding protein
MSNAANTGTLIGRLAADPRVFNNADGSKKVMFTLYVDRSYRTADGKTISDQVSTEAFVNNKVDGIGPFAYAHQGDLVALSTHIEQLPYTKDGQVMYPAAKVVVDGITFLESRGATQARLAKRTVAAEAPAAEAAPAAEDNAAQGTSAYDNETPFAGANS